ncbi:carbonic anhydrase family protein [Pontibacter akesuensis]|uniref:Carbonic anhydrase n=1 Tax=Pontibacter akesuensis TaxID=388950 RepID=A0A1I7FKK5_9BACT|nr:carbonic anhydrase family protein [Pontibacter akesuensis]GHA61738.1 carbonic anhydrase [Pontibacter akesuensis]SFU36694.1 carbonic anhydrase [Pontibacter akesuensis]
MRTHTKETQQSLTPDKALLFLKEGNQRFVGNLKANRNLLQQVNETSEGQFPFATILSCIDSRTSSELIFDQGLGDVFSIRIAGNILNQDILGSMEFACKVAGSKLLLVLGHTRCGAIYGACNHVEMGNLTALLEKVKPAMDAERETPPQERNGGNDKFVYNVTVNNVHCVIDRVRRESPVLADMEKNGEIKIVGGLYDVETGQVTFYGETDEGGQPA